MSSNERIYVLKEFAQKGCLLLALLFVVNGWLLGQEKKVCITVDDLPSTSRSLTDQAYINQKLTGYFQQHQIPAIGFVNEGKLYAKGHADPKRIQFLEQWLDRDLELGNHTFSHIFINQVTLEEYQEDVLRGEKILRPLLRKHGKELKFFRHTQLRTGPTDEFRTGLNQFLSDHGYTVAPVTIDNDEYIYAFCYARAKEKNDEELLKKISRDYLTYMKKVIEYYERLSADYLGYELPQILLIHANLLNADYMDELVALFKERGYDFISLEEALKDEAYARPEGTHRRGPSWLHRWMVYDEKPTSSQPSVSSFINKLYQKLRR